MICLVRYDFCPSFCSIHTLPISHSIGSVQSSKMESSYGIGIFNFLLLFVIMPVCFTTLLLIQVRNAVFSYAIQAPEAVSDVFLALPLLACVAFRCVNVCSCAKWTHLISYKHSLISTSASSWSQEATVYMTELFSARQPVLMHRHSTTCTSCKRRAWLASEELLTPCFTT